MKTSFEFFVRFDRIAALLLAIGAAVVGALAFIRPDWAGVAGALWFVGFLFHHVLSAILVRHHNRRITQQNHPASPR